MILNQKNWLSSDKTTYEYGLHQVISDPAHNLEISSSCISLIFTLQPNLVIDSGVHSSLPRNCYHQIILAKFNWKICYPPLYERVGWHYPDVNNDLIQCAISQFNWEKDFSNKGVNKQIYFQYWHWRVLPNVLQRKLCQEL